MYLTLEQYLEMERKTKELEKQIEALNKWIEDHKGICPFIESDIHNSVKEEEVLTPKEMNQWEEHIASLEVRSNTFSYGRKERMAESS